MEIEAMDSLDSTFNEDYRSFRIENSYRKISFGKTYESQVMVTIATSSNFIEFILVWCLDHTRNS